MFVPGPVLRLSSGPNQGSLIDAYNNFILFYFNFLFIFVEAYNKFLLTKKFKKNWVLKFGILHLSLARQLSTIVVGSVRAVKESWKISTYFFSSSESYTL